MATVMADGMWSTGFFPANNISIHYYRSLPPSGLGSPAAAAALPILIFLHGLVTSGGTLIEPASSFTQEFEVILPDARGHGNSSPIPKGSLLMENLVADAIAVLIRFGKGKPVFLMAHSMGAATAARVAKLRPDLVRALLLEEPPWRRRAGDPPNITESLVVSQTTGAPVRALRNMTESEFLAFDTAGVKMLPMAMSASAALRAFDIDDCEPTILELDIDIREAVEGITVPLELQSGDIAATCSELSISLLNPQVAAYTLGTYPLGSFQLFRNGCHVLHADSTKEEWTGDVLRFFRSFASVPIV